LPRGYSVYRALTGLIFNNLRRRIARTLLASLGIGVGVATIVALLSITTGLRQTAGGLIHLGRASFGVFQSGVGDPTASVLPEGLVTKLDRHPDVAAADPILLIIEGIKKDSSAVVFGLNQSGFTERRLVLVSGTNPGHGQIMVGDALAKELRLAPGKSLVVKGHRYAVSGVYHGGIFFEDTGAVLPLGEAQYLTDQLGEETTVAVQLKSTVKQQAGIAAIRKLLPNALIIGDVQEATRAGANNVLISKAILVIVALALVIGGIGVTNTMILAVMERQGELALLSTVGWSPWRVASLVLGEGVGVSLVGAAIGLLLGVIGSGLLTKVLSVSEFVSPKVTAWGLGRGLLVGVAIGVLGGLYPAWRVTHLDPVQGLRRA
jgi:putative ABC transport system permease protein